MKTNRLFILYIVCAFISACGVQYTDNSEILKAESLLNEQPDSAYNLLNSISNPEQLCKADYAAWCLHYTHAQHKLYKTIESDSLIKIAVEYYKGSNLKKYKGLSFYMLGCVSELLHKYENAMQAYKTADMVLKDTKDYNIKGLISINLGYLYVRNENYNQANIKFNQAVKLFELSGSKKYLISAYYELSNISLQLNGSFDRTMFYSNKALNLSKEINDSVLYFHILSRQGELLYRKQKKTAIANLKAGFNKCADLRVRNASFLAYLYSENDQPDSAIYYLKIASERVGDNETKIFNELSKAAVYENYKDFKQAFYSFEKAFLMQDTIFRNKLDNQLYRIERQFDLTEKEKENAELKIANRTKIIWIGALIIFILIILILLQQINIRSKRKQTAYEIERQKVAFELKEKELENRKKQELLFSNLQQRAEMSVRFNKLQQGFYEQKKQAEFVELLTNQVILSKTEWENYIKEANSIFDNKITFLKEKYKQLTPSDLIVIVLIILGLEIADTCVLLNMSKETMYVRRKRIKKHLGLESEIDLEMWIKQNII